MKQGGYHGRYLMINLSEKSWQVKKLPDQVASDYLGGRGIGEKLLYDLQEGKVDPLSPHNHLIIFTGPVTGTSVPGCSRSMFMCKSPLSNTINMSSMGGVFPNAFKKTGFDGLVLSGKSESRVWIHITPEGVARLSREIPGSEEFAMHVKGLELAAYDPRAVWGQGLSYAIAPRGGDHGRGGYMIVEFFMSDVDLYTHVGKAQRAAELSEQAVFGDSACLCTFNFVPIDLIPKVISAVVGKQYTEEGLREIARRVITLERKFNIREGFSRKDDTLPLRLLKEPLPDGPPQGKKVEGLNIMLDEYYQIRGWDKEGNPVSQ